MGPLDLVMGVLELNVADAASWFAQRFEVPHLPRRKHLKEASRKITQAGYETQLGLLVQSGLWAQLSTATQAIAPVLWEFSEPGPSRTRTVQISYAAIKRYSGVTSPNAIRKGLVQLGELNWLLLPECLQLAARLHGSASEYVLTPFSVGLNELAQARAQQTRTEIAAEREIRRRDRANRQRQVALNIQVAKRPA